MLIKNQKQLKKRLTENMSLHIFKTFLIDNFGKTIALGIWFQKMDVTEQLTNKKRFIGDNK